MRKLALGALVGTAVGVALDRLRIIGGAARRGSAGGPGGGAASTWPSADATVVGASRAARVDEVNPEDLTSPGTIDDPELEAQRAREAAERERESRMSDETKFDELRDLERERDDAQIVGDVPPPRDD